MRLWHKYLIPVLPDKQLQGQWRECCLIAKAVHDGNLNHLLVNKIRDYSYNEFLAYSARVFREMQRRGKNPIWASFSKHTMRYYTPDDCINLWDGELYEGWQNDRYLKQCFYNLQEKYDCGGFSWEEWQKVVRVVSDLLDENL